MIFVHTRCFGKLGKKELKGKQDKGFTDEIKQFFKAVKDGGPFPVTLRSMFTATEITFLTRESLRDGKIRYL